MKVLPVTPALIAIFCALLLLTACEHSVSTQSTVYDDGSLDRTIVIAAADSAKASVNMMGVSEARGWKTTIEPVAAEGKEPEYNITFTKHFRSVADANAETGGTSDTLFQIRSSIKNTNRWFFTYMEYSDTYTALDRFKNIPQTDFFTKEDYMFIDRLPAEGSSISSADSLYLTRLNEKIFDFYGTRTIFEGQFNDMLTVMRDHNVPLQWQDSLFRKKERIFRELFNEDRQDEGGPQSDSDIVSITSEMGILLPQEAREALQQKLSRMEKRLNFIGEAYSGKYVHSISMPWSIVSSNADSIRGKTLYWHPPAIKFLLQGYTMTARARKMNGWQTGISAAMILITIGLFWRRAGRKIRH
jgi:hypothetical protein